MGIRRVRHNKFFKIFTIIGASLGVVASTAFTAVMTANMNGRKGFLTEELREYKATFISEDTILSEATYKRGEMIEQPETPTHEIDGERNYIFIGWDTNGDNLIDFVPPRIYYSFTARAVFLNTGKFDLSFLDLSNMDLEKLLELLEKLNIDWEQFMQMFNIDPETLLDWLSKNAVLNFEADASSYISYFRSTSYGDYNFAKKKFDAPDYYDASRISKGSVNPLSFTADKIQNAYALGGVLPPNFGFINYDISFNAKQDYYPVPDCEFIKEEDNLVNSDAHYLLKPVDNRYQTFAAYAPATTQVIELLRLLPFSNMAIMQDQSNYYKYAVSKYLNVPNEYVELIDDIIKKQDWYEEDYTQVDSIGAYVENLGRCAMFNENGEIDLSFKKNKDPIRGLIENKSGSDLDFNITAMMIFRRLGIPARIVKGYVVPNIQPGYNEITLLNQHYWCEIYVKNVGWMICDCMNAEFMGFNPYGDLDKERNALINDKVLEEIEVDPPTKVEYIQGEEVDYEGMTVTAHYENGDVEEIPLEECEIDGFNTDEVGEHEATITYTEGDETKTATFTYTVKEQPVVLESVDFSFDQKEYYVGDTFDVGDITAIGHFSDGTVRDITDQIDLNGIPDTDHAGVYEVIATVDRENPTGEPFQDSYWVRVYEDEPVSFEITQMPDKTEYYTGQEFDPTGLVLTATYHSGMVKELEWDNTRLTKIGIEPNDFYYPDEHHTITLDYQRQNLTIIERTFEVTILKDEINTFSIPNMKTEYEVGDNFSSSIFCGGGPAKITLKSNPTTEISVGLTGLTIYAPDLSTTGTKHVTVEYTHQFTYGMGDKLSNVYDITVNAPDSKEYAFSNYIALSGPRDYLTNEALFNFTTSYSGTMYFKSKDYSTFDSNLGTWSNSSIVVNNTNTIDFTYDKLEEVYQGYDVSIEYLDDLPFAVTPMYNSAAHGYGDTSVLNGTVKNYTNVMTGNLLDSYYSYANMRRLSDYVGYNNQAAYNSYSSIVNTNYKTKSGLSSIKNFISNYGLEYYYDNDYARVNAVKSILTNYFTYKNDFNYYTDGSTSATPDAIDKFLEQEEGTAPQFASAAVLIFRELGIPARYCIGFGAQADGGTVTVGTYNTHAWAEVWFDHVGWVIVDPTSYDDGHVKTGSGYYGDGFGGAGLYNYGLRNYGGTIDINYNLGLYPTIQYKDGHYYYTYNGDSYYTMGDDGHKYTNYDSRLNNDPNVPSFLYYVVELQNEGAVDYAGEGGYQLTPVVHVYDRTLDGIGQNWGNSSDIYWGQYTDVNNNPDFGYAYNYQVGSGASGFRLYIVPAVLFVRVTPIYPTGKSAFSLSTDGTDGVITLTKEDFTWALDTLFDSDELGFEYDIIMDGSSYAQFNSDDIGTNSNYGTHIYVSIRDKDGNYISESSVKVVLFFDGVVIEP